MILIIDVLIAYLLDLIFGDPEWFPHPIRFIGSLIKKTEGFLRQFTCKAKNKDFAEKLAGFLLAAFVILTVFVIVGAILVLCKMINIWLFHIVNIYFIYSAIATKCLGDEALKVYKSVKTDNLEASRNQLAMLVGRETQNLSMPQIIRGVVETTAENTVDGIISPLIYAFIGSFFGIGAPLVYAFKAASTLDSMVGYKNDKYINMGMCSARFDDLLNYIPARLSGLIIPFSSVFIGKNAIRSFKIMLRDRRNHKSPNCAYPESSVAGALGVQLGGANVYFGKVLEKPTIGDPLKSLEPRDITDTVKIMYISSFVTVLICALVYIMLK